MCVCVCVCVSVCVPLVCTYVPVPLVALQSGEVLHGDGKEHITFIHSTTAGRTAMYTSYTAGIGSAVYVHHKLTLCTLVLGETIDIHRMLHTVRLNHGEYAMYIVSTVRVTTAISPLLVKRLRPSM